MGDENVSRNDIAKMIEASIQTNNQCMMNSMNELFQTSLNELKRSQVDSSDAQLREIKKIKLEEPKRFKKKANEDQFRFNSKLQDTLDETKTAVQANAMDKVKDSLQKGENLLKERQKHILLADKSEYGWSTVERLPRDSLREEIRPPNSRVLSSLENEILF